VISQAQAYHGATIETLALTGRPGLHGPLAPYLAGHLHIPPSTRWLDPSGEAHGAGMFVYKLPPSDHPIAELDGQYALQESSDVGEWHCVKQQGMKPDLNAVTGDNPAIEPGTHDKWE